MQAHKIFVSERNGRVYVEMVTDECPQARLELELEASEALFVATELLDARSSRSKENIACVYVPEGVEHGSKLVLQGFLRTKPGLKNLVGAVFTSPLDGEITVWAIEPPEKGNE